MGLDEVLEGTEPDSDLAMLFISPHHARRGRELVYRLRSALPRAAVFGCTGSGVVGSGLELEGLPALSLIAATLPGVQLHPFALEPDAIPRDPERCREVVGGADRGVVLLSDPFTTNLQPGLASLQQALPGVPVFGGQASGGRAAGDHLMIRGDRVYDAGLVGVGLSGDVRIDTIVAQGCRPVGPPMFVTRCEKNRILELDGKDPVRVLRDLHDALPAADQLLFRSSLFLGVQMREQDEYLAGDFLIRNILGVPKDRRGVAVAYAPERYQVVQLHVRDADAARHDLAAVLDRHATGPVGVAEPEGALLFSCVGRGRALFGTSGHDTQQFGERFGDVPLGGFFCNGEIGPVHGQAWIHGYTSVFALFRPIR